MRTVAGINRIALHLLAPSIKMVVISKEMERLRGLFITEFGQAYCDLFKSYIIIIDDMLRGAVTAAEG